MKFIYNTFTVSYENSNIVSLNSSIINNIAVFPVRSIDLMYWNLIDVLLLDQHWELVAGDLL